VSGKLITGQNPQSSTACANAVITALVGGMENTAQATDLQAKDAEIAKLKQQLAQFTNNAAGQDFTINSATRGLETAVQNQAVPPGAPPAQGTDLQVSFAPDKLGLKYTGNRVTQVTPGGQAEKKGVQVDWLIKKVGETLVANESTSTVVFETIKHCVDAGQDFTINFATRGLETTVQNQAGPPGAPPGGTWAEESYFGKVTILICLFCFWPIICCPVDKRQVYVAQNGCRYDQSGTML